MFHVLHSGLSSLNKNNPLYESQEISMDMFKEPEYEEEDDDLYDGMYIPLIRTGVNRTNLIGS